MAIGDYGAYVWKNGEDITKKTADKYYKLIDGKWIDGDLLEDVDTDKCQSAGGHAILVFDNFVIEFYKLFDPKIILNTGEEIHTNILGIEGESYINDELNLKIDGYNINTEETILEFEVEKGEDKYCIVIGSSFGNGWDKQKTSKFVKKYMVLGEGGYYLNHKWVEKTDIWAVLDYLTRKDDIEFQRYMRYKFGYKVLFKDLLHFKLNGILWNLERISEYNMKIKLLK